MPVLTPAGELPSLNDPANFNPRAIAALNWLVGLVAEIEGLSAADWFDVMQGLTDATAGRVMTTGAFGLGSYTAVTALSDFTADLRPTQFFRTSNLNSCTGAPQGASWRAAHGLVIAGHDDRQLVLMANGYAASDAGLDCWFGARDASTGPMRWARLFHDKNIVGTVSDAGGVPSGAIIEEGSNANGQYVKFADGHQICTHKVGGLDVNVGFGSLYRTDVQVWTYPAAFVGAPVVYPNGGNNTSAWGGGANVNSVSANAILVSVATLTNTEMLLMAIGRWK